MPRTPLTRTSPMRGPGHYSPDGTQWWDDASEQWQALGEGWDTLEIELEDIQGASFLASLMTTLPGQGGSTLYRFVGVAQSPDPRWPNYRIPGRTFPVARVLADDTPREAWVPGMTQAWASLRDELASCGWISDGHGQRPWSCRYTRRVLADR